MVILHAQVVVTETSEYSAERQDQEYARFLTLFHHREYVLTWSIGMVPNFGTVGYQIDMVEDGHSLAPGVD
jgi:hypothetical protein